MRYECIPLEDRYIPVPETGCWLWLGGWSINGYGYHRPTKASLQTSAHRFMYELLVGKIPDGMYLCHKCDTTPCVNPDHLFVGTPKENQVDCVKKNRRPSGSSAAHAILTDMDARLIRSSSLSTHALAKQLGVSQGRVWKIRTKKAFKRVI